MTHLVKEAIDQINSRSYTLPNKTNGRKVVKEGVQFDRETMAVGEYIVG